jgi:hypothetical protein
VRFLTSSKLSNFISPFSTHGQTGMSWQRTTGRKPRGSGCPSFLVYWSVFPIIDIVTDKFEDHEYVDEYGVYHTTRQYFPYKPHPTRRQLIREDTRYLDVTIPDEEKEYLDESCSFPDEPPETPGGMMMPPTPASQSRLYENQYNHLNLCRTR